MAGTHLFWVGFHGRHATFCPYTYVKAGTHLLSAEGGRHASLLSGFSKLVRNFLPVREGWPAFSKCRKWLARISNSGWVFGGPVPFPTLQSSFLQTQRSNSMRLRCCRRSYRPACEKMTGKAHQSNRLEGVSCPHGVEDGRRREQKLS